MLAARAGHDAESVATEISNVEVGAPVELPTGWQFVLEPMTCAPDAFNTGEGLRVLEPGEVHSARWGLLS
jgi:galactose mutarotase-like enzyme